MKRHHREALALIAGILEPRGFVCSLTPGRVHFAVTVHSSTGRFRGKFPVSGSPRDSDAQLNQIRQQVHHWLDTQGMGSGRGHTGERRQKTHRAPHRPIADLFGVQIAEDPRTGPARDPWAKLAGFRVGG